MMYAGDEYLSDEQQNPKLASGEGDPLADPCWEAGAEPGVVPAELSRHDLSPRSRPSPRWRH